MTVDKIGTRIRRSLSQRAVAKQLGVSQMHISRALRGENGISEEARRRILDIYRHAGIPLPRSRKVPSPKLLHMLSTIAPPPSPDTDFHARLLGGIARGARDCGAEMANIPGATDACWPQMVLRKHADGVVVVWGDEMHPAPHADCPIAPVFVFHGPPHADVVDADNFMAGHQLGARLAARGHRRVAFFGTESLLSSERLAGLRTGLESQGGGCPPDLTFRYRSPFDDASMFADRVLAETGWERKQTPSRANASRAVEMPFTALVCYNDYLAGRVIMRLRDLGLRVPADISVAGFDGASLTWYDGPKLTTCALPLEELGAEAARMIYWRIEHPNAIRRKLALETELVKGETVGRVSGEGSRSF